MIPSYNAGRYLADALRSVLAQDPGVEQMQIEVVDDGSSTDPTALVRALCGDRVTVHRHPENRGHVATFNTCVERATGEIVHLLHADDQVRDGFYARLGEALDSHPEAGAAFCRYIAVDGDGNWTKIGPLEQAQAGILEGWHELIAVGQRLQPPCIVVRKRVYEAIGSFDPRIRSYGEDWEMWTRIAASYPVWYEPEPLALYRVGGDSLSSAALRTGENVRQLLQVIDINRERLPAGRAADITTRARRVTARTAAHRALRLARSGDAGGALAQLRWSLRADRSPGTLVRVLAGLVQVARAQARQRRRRHAQPPAD
jgi:glycosyltransferase involved in cell wall biosynthesis